jgi:protein SCO1/2
VELVSITIDPENDLIETIRSYSEGFGADTEGWHWLRDSHEETKKVTEDFQMSKKEMDGFVAHNTTMYLLDRENQIRALHDMAKPEVSVDTNKIINHIYMLINE